jgi:uncharacterized protein YfaQ (DUF2300 family)
VNLVCVAEKTPSAALSKKGQHLRLVSLMKCENILNVTDTIGIASFLADFYALCASASLELVAEATFQHILCIPAMQT